MSYINGGEGENEPEKDDDPASRNPTGFRRRSSARTRRKKDRRLFDGTPWAKPEKEKDQE